MKTSGGLRTFSAAFWKNPEKFWSKFSKNSAKFWQNSQKFIQQISGKIKNLRFFCFSKIRKKSAIFNKKLRLENDCGFQKGAFIPERCKGVPFLFIGGFDSSALCRSRREFSNEFSLAKFGCDAAENEPCKVCPLSA